MSLLKLGNPAVVPLAELPLLAAEDFLAELRQALTAKKRILGLFAAELRGVVYLFACCGDYARKGIEFSRTVAPAHFASLSPDFPAMQLFEREIHEQYGILPQGHPWLKPVRLGSGPNGTGDYPFYGMRAKRSTRWPSARSTPG